MNLLHYSLNKYTRELTENAGLGYPMINTGEVILDSREDKAIEDKELEYILRQKAFRT